MEFLETEVLDTCSPIIMKYLLVPKSTIFVIVLVLPIFSFKDTMKIKIATLYAIYFILDVFRIL